MIAPVAAATAGMAPLKSTDSTLNDSGGGVGLVDTTNVMAEMTMPATPSTAAHQSIFSAAAGLNQMSIAASRPRTTSAPASPNSALAHGVTGLCGSSVKLENSATMNVT